jgi:phosphopantetheine adenylyltransferase
VSQLEAYIRSRSTDLQLKIVPLTEADPRKQPVVDNARLECIVVSTETEPAAEAINQVRLSKGLRALEIVTVDLVGEGSRYERLSSTEMRQRDLGQLLTAK